ncbi:MAG: hypothetical protein WA192_06550 [Candidatus Acidiferrales bacterium]
MSKDVQAMFGQIKWCNMGLLTMRSERGQDTDDFVIEIIDLYSGTSERSELRFKDTTYLSLEIDFASKRTCADAFDGADCRSESPWKKALADANPHDNFASYLHFRLGLVPKGGSINLLALDFEIQKL